MGKWVRSKNGWNLVSFLKVSKFNWTKGKLLKEISKIGNIVITCATVYCEESKCGDLK